MIFSGMCVCGESKALVANVVYRLSWQPHSPSLFSAPDNAGTLR